jgi:hypothetical protein
MLFMPSTEKSMFLMAIQNNSVPSQKKSILMMAAGFHRVPSQKDKCVFNGNRLPSRAITKR